MCGSCVHEEVTTGRPLQWVEWTNPPSFRPICDLCWSESWTRVAGDQSCGQRGLVGRACAEPRCVGIPSLALSLTIMALFNKIHKQLIRWFAWGTPLRLSADRKHMLMCALCMWMSGRFRGGGVEHAVNLGAMVQGGQSVASHHRHRARVALPTQPGGTQDRGPVRRRILPRRRRWRREPWLLGHGKPSLDLTSTNRWTSCGAFEFNKPQLIVAKNGMVYCPRACRAL